jgi:hypothetical protein
MAVDGVIIKLVRCSRLQFLKCTKEHNVHSLKQVRGMSGESDHGDVIFASFLGEFALHQRRE